MTRAPPVGEPRPTTRSATPSSSKSPVASARGSEPSAARRTASFSPTRCVVITTSSSSAGSTAGAAAEAQLAINKPETTVDTNETCARDRTLPDDLPWEHIGALLPMRPPPQMTPALSTVRIGLNAIQYDSYFERVLWPGSLGRECGAPKALSACDQRQRSGSGAGIPRSLFTSPNSG